MVFEAMKCADGAKRVAEGYARSGGAVTAADAVEQRLLGRQVLASPTSDG
jgi:hypothetical protein